MSYRKIKGEQIFDGYRLWKNKILVIDENGKVEGVFSEETSGQDIEEYEGIISPGFINCHCHLELSHMKGLIPEKTGLVDFVIKVVTSRDASELKILKAIEEAEEEMMKNGIVVVGDICNNSNTLTQKLKKNLMYYNFIESSGWLPNASDLRFERSKNIYEEFSNIQGYQNSIVPHAPYSVSMPLWKLIKPYFSQKVVSIHNQETAYEDEFFKTGFGDFKRMYHLMNIDNHHHVPSGKSSLQTYFHQLIEAKNRLLVHNTFISEEDIYYIKEINEDVFNATFFCLCVNANLYIENKLPDIDMLNKNNCHITIGTDSLASNHTLSIIDEIRTIYENYPHIPLTEILSWGTINGAKALRVDDAYGSFEKGKKPGIVLITKNFNAHILK